MPAFATSTPAGAHPFRRAKLVVHHTPVPTQADMDVWHRSAELASARWALERATTAYADACKWLGEANRRMSPNHSGAGVWPLHLRRAWIRSAFRDISSTRAALRTVRKAVAALGAA